MKLYATIESERGKPVSKSGNDYLAIELRGDNRRLLGHITITPRNGSANIKYHLAPDVQTIQITS